MFRRALSPAASVRATIVAMVLVAIVVTALGVIHVARRHEVVRLGYALAKASERLRVAEERQRRLELERATLTAPDRIRALAEGLGMVPTPPDQVRVVQLEGVEP
jgi:cell division protein FtsL